jgi:hypothetical protein
MSRAVISVGQPHECPSDGCTRSVPQTQLACREHWYALPKEIRDEVWRTYRAPGREGHAAAVLAAVEHMNGLTS